jgi:ABC-2 type transport system ATP-binding protein
MVKGLQNLGKTIFLTTHYMDEADYLADRVAIISRGRIVAEGPPATLAGASGATLVRFRKPAALDGLLTGLEHTRVEGDYIAVETAHPTELLYELTRRARESSRELEELTVTRSSLEDTYLRLVQESAE